MMQSYDQPPLSIVFPQCEESDSSCGETIEAEDSGRGGYHPAKVGETFKSGRYRALCRLGSGHFSTVWLCFDNVESRDGNPYRYTSHANNARPASSQLEPKNRDDDEAVSGKNGESTRAMRGRVVALKIQKSAPGYTDAANDEIRILDSIRKADDRGIQPVVRLLDHFDHYGVNGRHVCLVFDVMGGSLLHLIKRFNFGGVHPDLVKRITYDILVGLDFLHTQASIIHTDLKPENILMRLPPAMLYELDVRGAEFANELVSRKFARNGSTSSSRNALVTQTEEMVNTQEIRESKGQKKRRRRKVKAQAARALLESERAATAWRDESEVNGGGASSGQDSDKGGRLNGENGALKHEWEPGDRDEESRSIAHARRPPFRRGSREYSLTELQFNLKEILDIDAVFANGRCSIVDLGNACWINHQFTGDIQTRQYRSPEVIMGAPYGTAADMWSVACLVFELLTGEYLFDPHSGMDYDRDEDHLAQMMELLGPMPRWLTSRGRYARDLFNRNGELRNLRFLRDFPLHMVLMDRFRYSPDQAEEIASFLLPMLVFDPQKRATARNCLAHPFLTNVSRR